MPLNAHAAARLRSKKRSSSTRTASSTAVASPAPSASAKKPVRFRDAAPKDLRWKKIVLPAEMGFDDDGGLLELDEVEGVDVVYEEGRVAFKVRIQVRLVFRRRANGRSQVRDEDGEPPAKKSKKGKGKAVERDDDEPEFVPVDQVQELEGDEPAFADDEELTFPDEELEFPDGETGQAADAADGEGADVKKAKKQKNEKGKKRSRDEAQENGSNGGAIEEAADEPPFDGACRSPAFL